MHEKIYLGIERKILQGNRILDYMPVFGDASGFGNSRSGHYGRRDQDFFSGSFCRFGFAMGGCIVFWAYFNIPDRLLCKRNIQECGFYYGRKFSTAHAECADHLYPCFTFGKRGQGDCFIFYAFVCIVRHSACRVCENSCLQAGFKKVWVHKGGRRK